MLMNTPKGVSGAKLNHLDITETKNLNKESGVQDFLGGPVAKISCPLCKGSGFDRCMGS